MKQIDLPQRYGVLVKWFERALALLVLAGVVISAATGTAHLVRQDWTATETFYELIYRVLLLVIGLELARMLVTHSLVAVMELLAFVIARKMLKPDLTATDIALSVLAFVALMAARRYLIRDTKGDACIPQNDLKREP
jgi:hypothetical protein